MESGSMRTALTRPSATRMIIVVVLLAALMLGLYAATRFISGRSYDRLERREVTSAVDRAQGVIANRITGLSRVAGDYARWDDTYEYVRGANPTYIDDNFISDAMTGVGVDFMAVVNPETGAVAGKSADPATGDEANLPGYVRNLVTGSALQREYNPAEKSGSGVVVTPAGPLLFATERVTTTDGSKKSGAYLMTGRLLTAEELASLSDLARLPIRVFAAGDALGVPPGETPTEADLAEGKTATVPLHDGEIAGFRVLRDFAGDPAFTVGVTIPRTVSQAGDRAARGLAWALAIFGVAAGLLVARAMYLQQREVVERTHAEQHARESEERFRSLFDQMADAVFGIDLGGSIVFVNPRAIQLTGTARSELIGAPVLALLSADTAEHGTQAMRKTVHRGVAESFEAELVRARGEVVPVEISAAPLVDEHGVVTGAQWIVRDVTDRKRFEKELVHLANRDHLTGLYNRRRFEEELADQLAHAKGTETTGAVLWFDLDHFKDINDSLGHGAGDEVLSGVARTLSARSRAESMLARIGGDEFAVLLPRATLEDAEQFAERIIDDIHECVFYVDQGELRVSSSVGVVLFPDHGTNTEELLARADLAMYRAKEQGRNQYCLYRPDEDWQAELQARFDWSLLIENALRNDRFLVYAQPVIDLATGEIDRHELLIRMEAADGSVIPPGMFLSVAERTGQISQIDQWMVRRAIDLISMRGGDGRRCCLDVNLSGRAFSDPGLLPLIESELMRTGIDPAQFGVEITETAAVADMGKAREFIETLKKLGCRVALDDFGSGFSSFYYLRNLPIDCLKIDGSFIQNMYSNKQDQHVVRAIVELAAGFGISSTAEFVEDGKTLDMLREFGVTYAQGFHIAQPGPSWGDTLSSVASA